MILEQKIDRYKISEKEGKTKLHKLKEKLKSGANIRAENEIFIDIARLRERENGKNKQLTVLTEYTEQ